MAFSEFNKENVMEGLYRMWTMNIEPQRAISSRKPIPALGLKGEGEEMVQQVTGAWMIGIE